MDGQTRFLSPGGSDFTSDQHYIWGYQPHFAHDIDYSALSTFGELEPLIDPSAYLVAVRVKAGESPLVIIEPNNRKDH